MTIPTLGTVEKILSFVDKPWKIAAVVILAVTAVIGVIVWENRADVAEAVLQRWVQPRLHLEWFPKIGWQLMNDTSADFVALAQVQVRSNLLKNIDGMRRDDRGWKPAVNPRPIFGTVRDPEHLVAFVEGRPVCHNLDANAGEEERAETGSPLNLKRRCFIAIPPAKNDLLGILAIGWRQPLSAEAEKGAVSLLQSAAGQLTNWGS
jgi:hypothetical protein